MLNKPSRIAANLIPTYVDSAKFGTEVVLGVCVGVLICYCVDLFSLLKTRSVIRLRWLAGVGRQLQPDPLIGLLSLLHPSSSLALYQSITLPLSHFISTAQSFFSFSLSRSIPFENPLHVIFFTLPPVKSNYILLKYAPGSYIDWFRSSTNQNRSEKIDFVWNHLTL